MVQLEAYIFSLPRYELLSFNSYMVQLEAVLPPPCI